MKKIVILLSVLLSVALYSCNSNKKVVPLKETKHTMIYAHVPLANGTELGFFYFNYPISGDSIRSMMMEKGFDMASATSLPDFAKIAKDFNCFRNMSPMTAFKWQVEKPLYFFHGREIYAPTVIYNLSHPELVKDIKNDVIKNSVDDSLSFTTPKKYNSWFLALNTTSHAKMEK